MPTASPRLADVVVSVPLAKEPTRPTLRGGRPLVIGGSLIVILAIIVGSIVALELPSGPSSHGTTNNPSSNTTASSTPSNFHQEVTTGQHITSIQVGTGIDITSGSVRGERDTFHVGDIACVVFTFTDLSSGIDVKLFEGTDLHDLGAINSARATYNGICRSVQLPGIDKWEVDYNGTPEASITFQVLS
jgi:hypothetical protein